LTLFMNRHSNGWIDVAIRGMAFTITDCHDQRIALMSVRPLGYSIADAATFVLSLSPCANSIQAMLPGT